MAQADQTIQNNTFPAVRADINNNLAALFTNSSGATAPTVTVAYQDWIDTSGVDPVWKKRNAANNAWITLGTIIGNAIAFEGTLPDQSGNAGEYLKTDGTNATWEPIVSGINAADVFASSGTWTCPAGVTKVLAAVVGGGGGGKGRTGTVTSGSNGGEGGNGGYGLGLITVTPGTVYTVTVGAAGNGGGAGANGTGGGTSTFSTISATGGDGATTSSNAANGSCSSADANLRRVAADSVPFIVGGLTVRSNTAGTSGIQWTITNGIGAGIGGNGGTTSTTSAAGGVGGAVLLLY
jgi:hypothetical protein